MAMFFPPKVVIASAPAKRQDSGQLRASGVRIDGVFVTEPSPNTFLRLPIREGENVLVWFGTLEGALEGGQWGSPLADPPTLLLELDPTPRSLCGRPRA